MSKLLSILFLIVLPLISCHTSPTSKASIKSDEKQKDSPLRGFVDTTFRLAFFKAIPNTFNLCNEVLCVDTVKAIKSNYIFVSDTERFGMIQVNEKIIYLRMDSNESSSIAGERFRGIFKGSGWTVIVDVKIKEKEDDVLFETGTIEIMFGRYRQIIKVKGESEC